MTWTYKPKVKTMSCYIPIVNKAVHYKTKKNGLLEAIDTFNGGPYSSSPWTLWVRHHQIATHFPYSLKNITAESYTEANANQTKYKIS